MNTLFKKNELWFSLLWIILYVVTFSIADSISLSLGTAKLITAPLTIVFALLLFYWIKHNHFTVEYGICSFQGNAGRYLYFLPLVFISSTNLWGGITFRLSVMETVLYIISMLCVGFIEEIIFRGFLFKALCKRESTKKAILISSITFGIGHIVNLLNGAELFSTLCQLCYACAIGFLFTIIFYKGKSLIPCIVTHSAVNSLSVFAKEATQEFNLLVTILLTVVSIGYALLILKNTSNVKGDKL